MTTSKPPKATLIGKGRLIYELMESLGIEPLIFGYQTRMDMGRTLGVNPTKL
jgi:hypothetical protein